MSDPLYLSPDCRGVDHSKCVGCAWNTVTDELVTCGCDCGCYYRNWEQGEGNHHERPAD
jgi:hypothetical protein